jgi:hypothetical protein
MKIHCRLTLIPILFLLGTAVHAQTAQRDMYQQHPGFRAIEFGSQPTEVMTLADASRAPNKVYRRAQDSARFGLAIVEPASYYFHDQHGFYKAVFAFRSTQNAQVMDELIKQFGGVTQILPLGTQDLLIWIRLEHTVQFTRAANGSSSVKITSTTLTPKTGDN